MFHRKLIYGVLLLLFAVAIILGIILGYSFNSQNLKVIFFDVEQGDAILISQGNNQVLIDGGKDGKIILGKLGKYIPFWDRTIEAVIATHPDQDHIGGLIDVARNYKIEEVIETRAQSDSQTYKSWEDIIGNKKIQKIEAIKDTAVKFSNGAEADIIYPFSSVNSAGSNSNDWSVVAKVNFGENDFLLTGDLPSEKETELLNNESIIGANILKVAHHGSRYSTSEEFLSAVNPEEAVISVGKNNSYGHPAPEIIERLLKHGIKIFRTDEIGDVAYNCNPPAGGQSEKPARNASPSDAGGCKMEFN